MRDRRRHVCRGAGELDLASAASPVDAVSKHCGEGAEAIVLDIGDLDFIDSTGLRAILTSRAAWARGPHPACWARGRGNSGGRADPPLPRVCRQLITRPAPVVRPLR
jgi:hypothetical protein